MMRDHRPVSIADQVFEQLERDILTGKYPQGEILSEPRLSAELGVSRTPIREAIRRLEQEHILEDTSRGLVVVGISRQDMLDIYEIRRQVEGLAAGRAVHALEEHTAIYEALAAHDAARASEAALRHVANARASIADITRKEED